MRTRIYIGYGLGVIAIAGALVAATGNDVLASDMFPIRCNETHCLVRKEVLFTLIENCGFKNERDL